MGSRANLVFLDQQGTRLFYCHWCADGLIRDLFWGPSYAISYVLRQRPTDTWLDDVWAEGGVIIDTVQKMLLLFGGVECHEYDPRLIQLYLELLGFVWNGWTIRWASGILDLADYVGLPRKVVRAEFKRTRTEFRTLPPSLATDANAVSSLVLEDGTLRLFTLYAHRVGPYVGAIESLVAGPSLIERLKSRKFETQLAFQSFPQAGFHI